MALHRAVSGHVLHNYPWEFIHESMGPCKHQCVICITLTKASWPKWPVSLIVSFHVTTWKSAPSLLYMAMSLLDVTIILFYTAFGTQLCMALLSIDDIWGVWQRPSVCSSQKLPLSHTSSLAISLVPVHSVTAFPYLHARCHSGWRPLEHHHWAA